MHGPNSVIRSVVFAAAVCTSAVVTPKAGEPVAIWDTVRHSDSGLSAGQITQKNGWRKLDGAATRVTGDLCVENERLVLALRRGALTAECYAKLADKTVKVADLLPASARGKAQRLEAFKLVEAKPQSALVEARFARATVAFFLRQGEPFVEARGGDGARKIVVEARSKYAVLPDLFASDLVVSASDTQAAWIRFPSENMLLQLIEGRDAIVACVWRSREQRVALSLDGAGDGRAFTATEIEFGKEPGLNVWVAVLAAPAIWAEKRIGELHPVRDTAVNWRVPFRALWRADYRRTDGLIDSWKCPIHKGQNRYEGFDFTPKKARTIWLSSRGPFAYPTCIEGGTCFLRKTQFEERPEIKYDDSRSVVIYPFRAIEGSPAGTFGALDVLREALKHTPQASLHGNLQIQHVERDKWPATCGVTGQYEKIFDAGEEKAKKKFLLERLEAMHNFVLGIRSRMNEFLDWGRRTRAWLATTKVEKPQLAALADEADGCLAMFGKIYDRRKLDERTPPAARVLIDKVILLIDSNEDHEKKLEKIKQLGRDTRTIGGNQDYAIGEFRLFSKQLRQRAGYWMTDAKDDAVFEFARQVRQRTMEVLQCAFNLEGAHID